MNDPVRLLEVGTDAFEAELLRAGRADSVPAQSRRQILAGVGIGGLLTASTVATGVRAGVKGWMAAGVSAAGAVAVWVGIHAGTGPAPHVAPVPAPVPAPAPRILPRPAPVEAPVVTAPLEPAPVPVVVSPVHAVARGADGSLTAELAALEQAHGAFLAHDYPRTLRLLDDYARHFPKHQLGSEAKVLRIEALAAEGDRDNAARIGRDFLLSHPNGPYAKRVRSVIGEASAGAHAP